MVELRRVELPTSAMRMQRSSQLSYNPMKYTGWFPHPAPMSSFVKSGNESGSTDNIPLCVQNALCTWWPPRDSNSDKT